jgi:cobalt/nickel transport system ATP-binding protein
VVHIDDHPHAALERREHPLPEPILQVADLGYTYPGGHQALRGVSFSLAAGEKVALVGANGAGKSTLLLALSGILQAEGRITVAGTDLTHDSLPVIRARVGLVFQNPDDQLFCPTVFDDVAFGPLHMGLPAAEVRALVDHALDHVGMRDYTDRMSHHLSVGEKKRIAIATVLSMDPQLLVLDEPSAGLDPRARRSLIRLLDELPQAMLVATHDIELVHQLLPRTIVLEHGRVLADGPTDQLLTDADLLDRAHL